MITEVKSNKSIFRIGKRGLDGLGTDRNGEPVPDRELERMFEAYAEWYGVNEEDMTFAEADLAIEVGHKFIKLMTERGIDAGKYAGLFPDK